MQPVERVDCEEDDFDPLKRLAVMASSLILAATIHFTHQNYLTPVWEDSGFKFFAPFEWQYIFAASSIIAVSCAVPTAIRSAADLILVPFYCAVYIPTIVITLAIAPDTSIYLPALTALSFSLLLAFLAARLGGMPNGGVIPARWAIRAVVVTWIAATAILLAQYGGQIRFVGISGTYDQRAVTQGAVGTLIGYAQTYYLWMINPLLLATGLLLSIKHYVLLSLFGFALIYGIDAQKVAIAMPVAIACVYFAIRWMPNIALSTITILLVETAALIICVKIGTSPEGSAIASVFAVRTIGIPAQTFTQYYDYFANYGFTWWSNVRIIGQLAPVTEHAQNADWPVIGRIVGEHYYPSRGVNQNANIFASDGIAAAGTVGILVVGAIFAILIFTINRASRTWALRFAIPALLPLTFALLNASIFTTLLSFGGFAWLLFFTLCGEPRSHTPD
ncbi:hypothetical protein X566_17630 [Afipia sp. P52-10]|nr:hypothetical protein X566_17630 [Afipia sp. P52-10]